MTLQAEKEKVAYKVLNLSPEIIERISVTPIVSDGKLLFDKKNEDHRYIVEDENNEKQY